jgi:hypothetical protein
MPSFSTGVQRPSPRRAGTVVSRVNGITRIEFDGGGYTTMHPSAYKGYTGAVGEDFLPAIGTRVEVLGGTETAQCERAWRAESE